MTVGLARSWAKLPDQKMRKGFAELPGLRADTIGVRVALLEVGVNRFCNI